MSARRGRRAARDRTTALLPALLLLGLAAPARPDTLDQAIPGLFGGVLETTIDPNAPKDVQQVGVAERFQGLSASLATARSQAPVPSASGAFRFAWDPELDTFVRRPQSLGSDVAERATTLGRGVLTIATSYSRVDFDTLDGDSLNHIEATQPAFTDDFLAQLPREDQETFGQDELETILDLDASYDLLFLSAAYGVRDDLDIGIAISLNHARMKAHALARIVGPDGSEGHAVFAYDQPGLVTDSSIPGCERPNSCAVDSFDESAFSTGDVFLRGKWNFADLSFVHLATVAVLTLPTGSADDLLGFHDPTFTPWLVASESFGILSPHLNLGYAFRDGQDVSQAQWIAGWDLLAADGVTLSADFLGFHDDKRDDINDDILQSALGFKLNPFGNFVLGGSFQFPLNRQGLRADVIYSARLEYTF